MEKISFEQKLWLLKHANPAAALAPALMAGGKEILKSTAMQLGANLLSEGVSGLVGKMTGGGKQKMRMPNAPQRTTEHGVHFAE